MYATVPSVLPGLVSCAESTPRVGHRVRRAGRALRRAHFSQPKVQNLRVTARGVKNIRRLDVAMHDALRVRRIQGVSHFDGQVFQRLQFHRLAANGRVSASLPSRNSMAMNALPFSSPMSWMVQMLG